MALKNSIGAIEALGFPSTVMEADTYQPINTSGLPYPCFLVRIINNTTEDVLVSYDGSTDNDFVPKGMVLQLPLQTNSQPTNQVALMPKGTVIYVKGTAGTGECYLAAYYSVPASV